MSRAHVGPQVLHLSQGGMSLCQASRVPRGKRTPQRNSPTSGCFQKTNEITADPRVAAFLNRKDVTANQAMTVLEVVFGAKEEGAKEWPTKEELVNQVSILKDV